MVESPDPLGNETSSGVWAVIGDNLWRGTPVGVSGSRSRSGSVGVQEAGNGDGGPAANGDGGPITRGVPLGVVGAATPPGTSCHGACF